MPNTMLNSFDSHLFTQFGLDSAKLTMAASVIHSFGEAGQYRGTVRRGAGPEATFYVSVDKHCAVAQENIDLARIVAGPPNAGDCCGAGGEHRFVVHPKGYVLFHVGGGAGGFSVNVRIASDEPDLPAYDTQRQLLPGDRFAGVLLRPGTYVMRNLLTQAEGELVVAYPVLGKTPNRPSPVSIESGAYFEPRRVELVPAQGIVFDIQQAAHIQVELVRPDDGPRGG